MVTSVVEIGVVAAVAGASARWIYSGEPVRR